LTLGDLFGPNLAPNGSEVTEGEKQDLPWPKFLMKPPFWAFFCPNPAFSFCKSLIINI
jgi:hypothetical protein